MSMLSDYLRSQADWRQAKADEYPEDARNARSAAALESLAGYVDAGADATDARTMQTLHHYAEVHAGGTGFLMPGDEIRRAVSRFGFDYAVSHDMQLAEMLDSLVAPAVFDTYELVQSSAPDEDRSEANLAALADHYGLNWWEVEAALDGVSLGRDYFERRSRNTELEQRAWIETSRAEESAID